MSNRTFVIGVGMTKFEKPGTKEGDYPDWAKEAGEKALADAGIPYEDVEQAYAGYCYGDSTYGQRALYQLGLTGIPVVNVNNNCSTGSSALFLARQAVKGGLVDCALAVGFEKMEPGCLGVKYTDRTNALDKHAIADVRDSRPRSLTAGAADVRQRRPRPHAERYGSTPDHFAWIGWKNHKHSVNNPYAQFQDEYSLEDIKAAKMIHDPLTKLQCSPTSDGSACAIVASERYVDEHDLWDQAIEIAGQSMVTDLASTFDEDADCMTIVGSDMSAAGRRHRLRGGRGRPRRGRRLRAARLLQRQRADHLRSARLRRGGRGSQAGRGGSDDLRRRGRGQPLRRPDLQGAPARRDRAGAVLGTDLAAARRSRQAPGRGREGRPAAQHRPRRRRRGHRLQTGELRSPTRQGGGTMAKQRRVIGAARSWRSPAAPAGSARRRRRRSSARGAGWRSATSTWRWPRRRLPRSAAAALALALDVTDRASFEAFLDEAERQLGPDRCGDQQRRDHAGDAVRRGDRGLDPAPDRHQPASASSPAPSWRSSE